MTGKKKAAKGNAKMDFQSFVSKLENMILTGGFKPRERLIESNVSQMFNVSRYWVRDSFKILETKGLVVVTPFKGVVVSELSEQEVEEIFVIRVALERLAIDLAVENIRPKDIETLEDRVARFEEARENGDLAAMVEADSDFHDYIFTVARNQSLKKMINELRNRCHIIRYSAWSSPDILGKVNEEHRLLVRYLEARDKEKLNELAERHIGHAKTLYLFQLQTENTLSL